jgi:hypothetical protein
MCFSNYFSHYFACRFNCVDLIGYSRLGADDCSGCSDDVGAARQTSCRLEFEKRELVITDFVWPATSILVLALFQVRLPTSGGFSRFVLYFSFGLKHRTDSILKFLLIIVSFVSFRM